MQKSIVLAIILIFSINCQVFVGSPMCAQNQEPYWTNWLDRDNPSGNGDYELLSDFVKQGKTCQKPTDIICETTSGISAASTGELVTIDPSKGCICINKDQPDKKCNYDYRVKFQCCKCKGSEYWTDWLNRDRPSASGDWETLSDFLKEGKACANPTDIRCETTNGTSAASTGELVTVDPSKGCICINKDQPDKKCNYDYRVKFQCCGCKEEYWTSWLNRDRPSGSGDWETLSDFVKEGKVCPNPTDIRCETIFGRSAAQTGEKLTISPSLGCICKNADQKDKKCKNYRAKFKCCK